MPLPAAWSPAAVPLTLDDLPDPVRGAVDALAVEAAPWMYAPVEVSAAHADRAWTMVEGIDECIRDTCGRRLRWRQLLMPPPSVTPTGDQAWGSRSGSTTPTVRA